jgi:hypothetical protein
MIARVLPSGGAAVSGKIKTCLTIDGTQQYFYGEPYNAVKGFDVVSIAPNPVVAGNFKLNVASAQTGKMDISILDMQGRLVNRQTIELIAGYNSMPVNVANLSAGTYTIRGSMADVQSGIIRFVKQ